MGWIIGYNNQWQRDIGYGVPAICDHPGCNKEINRGLSYVCGEEFYEPEGEGCGLYFCEEHRHGHLCERCQKNELSFEPKPDSLRWINFKLKDKSWKEWRKLHPEEVKKMKAIKNKS